jgi:Uma2 family endonuclease
MAVIRTCDYGGSVPDPEDVLLLIEVSDTSLSYDLGARLPLYARAAIPEIWIVDEVIERHTDPSGDGYRSLKHARRGEEIESAVLPELAFRVDAVPGWSRDTSRTNEDTNLHLSF